MRYDLADGAIKYSRAARCKSAQAKSREVFENTASGTSQELPAFLVSALSLFPMPPSLLTRGILI